MRSNLASSRSTRQSKPPSTSIFFATERERRRRAMNLLQQLKNSLAGKSAVPLLSGATTNGMFTEHVIAAVRRTVRHPLTEGAVLLAGSQYVAAAVGLVTSVV